MSRVWMITGAGRGLGRAFAEEALRNGDLVIATVRKVNPDDELFKNENVFTVIMDVTKTEEVRVAVDSGLQKFGRIDVLINNAGLGIFALLLVSGAVIMLMSVHILFWIDILKESLEKCRNE